MAVTYLYTQRRNVLAHSLPLASRLSSVSRGQQSYSPRPRFLTPVATSSCPAGPTSVSARRLCRHALPRPSRSLGCRSPTGRTSAMIPPQSSHVLYSEWVVSFWHILVLGSAWCLTAVICLYGMIAQQHYWLAALLLPLTIVLGMFSVQQNQVDDSAVYVRYLGICFRKIKMADIVEHKQCSYDWKVYGGWGIKRAMGCFGSSGQEVSTPQWAYSVMGVPECVRLQTEKVAVDISSKRAAELAACIEARRRLGAGLNSASNDSNQT